MMLNCWTASTCTALESLGTLISKHSLLRYDNWVLATIAVIHAKLGLEAACLRLDRRSWKSLSTTELGIILRSTYDHGSLLWQFLLLIANHLKR